MKRKERKHLKENELVRTIAAAREYYDTHRRQITAVLVGALVVVVGLLAVSVIRQQSQSRGQDLLAEAMVALNARVVPAGAQGPDDVPAAATLGATGTFATEEAKLNAALPKLQAAADTYPGSDAGITARYHLAGAYAALGRYQDAIREFDQVVQRSGSDSLYGRMALLGKASAQVQAGAVDEAIGTLQDLVSNHADELPADAILMQLGRAYATQGNRDEAVKTFTRLLDEHPESQYSPEARAELDSLKG